MELRASYVQIKYLLIIKFLQWRLREIKIDFHFIKNLVITNIQIPWYVIAKYNIMLYFEIVNVKKTQHRTKIIEFLQKNSSSEVKEIAEHIGVTKQALYYHINLLIKEKKITVAKTSLINGIEKKYYSIFINSIKKSKGVFPNKSKKTTPKSLVKKRAKKIKNERSNKKNIPIKNDKIKSVLSNPHSYLIDDYKELKAKIKKDNDEYLKDSSLNEVKSQPEDDLDATIDVIKPDPKEQSASDRKKESSAIEDSNKFNLSESLQTVFSNIKSLGLFNIDSYDTMGSATVFITSKDDVISFNNRTKADLMINSNKYSKRNERLIIIDENFIDNHERIKSPLKKEEDQKSFIKRYIQKKYNISLSELIYSYEVFNTNEKGLYELNTLFSQKKYLKNSNTRVSEFPNKDKFFISISGLFSHYNNAIDRSGEKVNLYIYFGKKDCEVTWIKGKQILYNRSILVSNQILDFNDYIRETLHRVAKTISVSKNNLLQEGVSIDNSNNVFLTGPNSTKELLAFFNEKYKQVAKKITVNELQRYSDSSQKNEYLETALVIRKSMRKWGRFRYVYNQEDKSKLRKAGKRSLIHLASVFISAALILFNIKTFLE